jgi:hypothetical protein
MTGTAFGTALRHLRDLEGRPVAGARVEADAILFDEQGDLPGWIAKARNGAAGKPWQGLARLSLKAVASPGRVSPIEPLAAIAATTGADGRFTLTGIGRDRIADLIVSSPGIATSERTGSVFPPRPPSAACSRRWHFSSRDNTRGRSGDTELLAFSFPSMYECRHHGRSLDRSSWIW